MMPPRSDKFLRVPSSDTPDAVQRRDIASAAGDGARDGGGSAGPYPFKLFLLRLLLPQLLLAMSLVAVAILSTYTSSSHAQRTRVLEFTVGPGCITPPSPPKINPKLKVC
eukprot:COSAG01_NODE_2640_length_7295_cov_4.485955_10_plen_109_part_01